MRKPLVDADNLVVNIIEIEPDAIYSPPDGLTMLGEHPDAVIGGSYDPATDTFVPPPAPDLPPPEPTETEQKAALYDQAVRDGLIAEDPSVSVAPADPEPEVTA